MDGHLLSDDRLFGSYYRGGYLELRSGNWRWSCGGSGDESRCGTGDRRGRGGWGRCRRGSWEHCGGAGSRRLRRCWGCSGGPRGDGWRRRRRSGRGCRRRGNWSWLFLSASHQQKGEHDNWQHRACYSLETSVGVHRRLPPITLSTILALRRRFGSALSGGQIVHRTKT